MFAKLTEASFGGVAHVAARGQDDRALLLHRLIPAPFNIGVKRLKLRLSGSARKSQTRFRDTPRFKFQAVLGRIQPFLCRSVEKRGDQS
jgi:hypothetical protein